MPELLTEVFAASDPEAAIRRHAAAFVEESARRAAAGDRGAVWRRGEPLRLLLVGYAGGGNTGADVRVSEIVRQVRALFGERVAFGLVTVGPHVPRELFPDVEEVAIETYFPEALFALVRAWHGVIACEGSMFKSTFSDSLAMMMVAALGYAAAAGKPAIAYGAEAGTMNAELAAFAARACGDALIVCRNEASRRVLAPLGLRATSGVDTAWTFDPASPDRARERLRAAGWDGTAEIVGIAPVHPFWWPVRVDLPRAQRLAAADDDPFHYGFGFFHRDDDESRRKYERYLDGIAAALGTLGPASFPIVVGMDRIDRQACADLCSRLERPLPRFVSGDVPPGEIVALLRTCATLVTSRFHAAVTALPAGVPVIALSMDERLKNLLDDGARSRLLAADDPELATRLAAALRAIPGQRDEIAAAARRTTARALDGIGEMGIALCDELCARLDGFAPPNLPRTARAYLPALSPLLRDLLEDAA